MSSLKNIKKGVVYYLPELPPRSAFNEDRSIDVIIYGIENDEDFIDESGEDYWQPGYYCYSQKMWIGISGEFTHYNIFAWQSPFKPAPPMEKK